MRPTHLTMVAVVALLVGAALVAVIALRSTAEQSIAVPPALSPPLPAPVLPARGTAVTLQPAPPMAATSRPPTHAATPPVLKRTGGVSGDEDGMPGQPQRQMASDLCGNFGISC